MESPRIYRLVARSIRRPSVWNESAPPIGYFNENFNGQPLPECWKPLPYFIRGTSYRASDCVLSSQPGPLLSARAVEIFETVAPGCAEYRFFTTIKDKPYFVMNVLVSEDILDETASEVTRSQAGDIITVVKYAFRKNPIRPLFKLPRRFNSDTLCTEQIPEAVVKNKLTGFGFWDPSKPVIRDLFLGKDLNCYPDVVA